MKQFWVEDDATFRASQLHVSTLKTAYFWQSVSCFDGALMKMSKLSTSTPGACLHFWCCRWLSGASCESFDVEKFSVSNNLLHFPEN